MAGGNVCSDYTFCVSLILSMNKFGYREGLKVCLTHRYRMASQPAKNIRNRISSRHYQDLICYGLLPFTFRHNLFHAFERKMRRVGQILT